MMNLKNRMIGSIEKAGPAYHVVKIVNEDGNEVDTRQFSCATNEDPIEVAQKLFNVKPPQKVEKANARHNTQEDS